MVSFELLNELIAPRRAVLIAEPNSFTARWYLQLKNQVVASDPRPRRVIVFFRDVALLRPTNGLYERWLRRAQAEAHESEPVYEEVLSRAGAGWALRARIREIVPF